MQPSKEHIALTHEEGRAFTENRGTTQRLAFCSITVVSHANPGLDVSFPVMRPKRAHRQSSQAPPLLPPTNQKPVILSYNEFNSSTTMSPPPPQILQSSNQQFTPLAIGNDRGRCHEHKNSKRSSTYHSHNEKLNGAASP
jgi:hypothetical protein